MKNVEDCKGSKGTFSNIYIYVYFYTHIKLAKVIGVTCNYLQPPATTPFTATSDGGEKKV